MNPRFLVTPIIVALAGCASDPVPSEQMRLTEQAVAQARGVGVEDGDAALELALSKLARAHKNLAEGDYKRARLLAEQAELDARLAEAQVLRSNSEAQVQSLNTAIERLRQRLGEQP